MSNRKTERRMGDVIGVIRPGELYDTNRVFDHTGIGEVKLRQVTREGRLKPLYFNGRNWYRADDLIALIESEAK